MKHLFIINPAAGSRDRTAAYTADISSRETHSTKNRDTGNRDFFEQPGFVISAPPYSPAPGPS